MEHRETRFTFALHGSHSVLTRDEHDPPMRRLWLVLLCAAFMCAHVGGAAAASEDQGILVRVRPPRFAIRELDGSRLVLRVNRATVITLNGRRVRLRRLRLGDVLDVDHVGRLAKAIRAVRP
jgi:hypothetical protein